jgi:hypothetical protein
MRMMKQMGMMKNTASHREMGNNPKTTPKEGDLLVLNNGYPFILL